MMNEFGEAKIVRGRRRRRGPAPRARRAPRPTRRSRSRCRAWPSTPTTPTPVGVFRAVERPIVRGRDAAAARRARPSAAAPATSPRCSRSGADLDGRLARRRVARSVERAEHHAGARLRARRTSSSAACAPGRRPRRGSARPTPGCTGSPRVGGALVDERGDRAGVVAVAPRRVREAGHHERLDDAPRRSPRPPGARRRAPRPAASGAGSRARGRRGRRGRARRSARIARLRARRRRRACSAPRVDDVERVGEPVAQVDAGRQVESRWIGSMQSSSSTSSTTSVMIASAPPTGRRRRRAARRGSCTRSRSGGGRRRARAARRRRAPGSRAMRAGIVDRAELVAHAVGVDAACRAGVAARAAR